MIDARKHRRVAARKVRRRLPLERRGEYYVDTIFQMLTHDNLNLFDEAPCSS
jgi:hypothetical protein